MLVAESKRNSRLRRTTRSEFPLVTRLEHVNRTNVSIAIVGRRSVNTNRFHLRRHAHKSGTEFSLAWLICEWPEDKDALTKSGSPTSPWTPTSPHSFASERCAGGSSTTTASSKTRRAQRLRRACLRRLEPPRHARFRPASVPDPGATTAPTKPRQQPDPLPARPRAPNAPGLLARDLPDPAAGSCRPIIHYAVHHDLTEHH